MRRIVREVEENGLFASRASSMNFNPNVVHRSVEYQSFGSRASLFATASPLRNSFAFGEPGW